MRDLVYNARLRIVALAYNDHASLHFRVWAKRPGAARAVRIIGRYNDFDPKVVIRFIRALPVGTKFEVGRENSPVLYVSTPDWQRQEETIRKAARKVGLRWDEFDKTGIWHWIWWD